MGKADLHIHTTVSDGNSEPAEIVALAHQYKLEVISITDHDSIKGLEEARETAESYGIEVLSGVEITTDFNGRECHLLAYCFDPDDPDIRLLLLKHKKARLDRGQWIIDRLAQKGLDIDINEVKAEANGSIIARPHIASVLVEKGYVGTFKEAFIRYLSDSVLGPIEHDYHTYHEVIEVVKQSGGVVVVAHPGQLYSETELEQLVEAGIDGVEVLHPSHNYETQKRMKQFAEKHRLLITGGSDFHGGRKDYQRFFGIVTISVGKARRVRQLAEQRKKISV